MPPPDPHHSLLLHADFQRRLARDLTREPDAGEDLAQQVWLRALRRPPHHDGGLRGHLVSAAANALRDASIEVCALTSTDSYASFVGTSWLAPVSNGTFAVADLPAGTYGLLLRDAPGTRLADGAARDPMPNSAHIQVIVVQAGETTTCELPVVPAARLSGRVTRGGAPVDDANVSTWLLPGLGAGNLFREGDTPHWTASAYATTLPSNPTVHASARTDTDGRYVLDGLPTGLHRVEVHAPGCTFDTRFDVLVSCRRLVPARVFHATERPAEPDRRAGERRIARATPRCRGRGSRGSAARRAHARDDQQQLVRLLRRKEPQSAKAYATGAVVLQVEPGEHLIVTSAGAQRLSWRHVTVPEAKPRTHCSWAASLTSTPARRLARSRTTAARSASTGWRATIA